MSQWLTRWRKWEYWPFSVFYFPVFFYFGWLALRHRSLFFFTTSNPSIDFGGMLGERKSEIFDLIPTKYFPKTTLIGHGHVEKAKKASLEIGYPLVAKPDVGERGIWVKKIANEEELLAYARECPADFLMQTWVDYPLELGVFYVRMPGEQGRVTSIVRKNFLSVTGDGASTVWQLLMKNERARISANLQSDFISREKDHVLADGQELVLEPIGNHSRGTCFLDDTHEIDAELTQAIESIAREIKGFYFGRFDLKCQSYQSLKQLQHFQLLELNGAGAEPAHVYQPGYSLLKAYQVICRHLHILSQISRANHKRGHRYWSFTKGYQKWKKHQAYNRMLSES